MDRPKGRAVAARLGGRRRFFARRRGDDGQHLHAGPPCRPAGLSAARLPAGAAGAAAHSRACAHRDSPPHCRPAAALKAEHLSARFVGARPRGLGQLRILSMRIRTLLLAGAVFPFAMSMPALAQNAAPAGFVLAQADPACPEGTECPPAAEPEGEEPEAGQGSRRQRAIERAKRRQQELQEQGAEQPAAEAPAAAPAEAAQPAPAEPPPPPPAEAAQPAPAEPPPPAPAEAAQPAPAEPPPAAAAEQPAVEQPAAAEPEPQGRRQRARRQQQGAEQPAAEAPAAQEAAPAQPAQAAPAEQPAAAAPEGQSTTEQQLEAQGDDEQADRIRALRLKLRRERQAAEEAAGAGEPAAEQAAPAEQPAGQAAPVAGADEPEGTRRGDRRRGGGVVIERRGDRIIIQEGDQIFIQPVVPDESERLLYGARDVEVEQLRGGLTRTIVYRDNGAEIITVRDRDGNIIRRVRRTPDGREFVLIDNRVPEGQEAPPARIILLPPPRIEIPEERYIVDIGRASQQQLQDALLAPPVQAIERPYTLEEVTRSESLRSYVPRIDLDTITFDFGSATISSDQMQALGQLGIAMEDVIAQDPDEVYLIEGHTD